MTKGFIQFIREKGVVGLAIGFVLGGSVQKVVTALVNDLINPLVSLALGRAEGLKSISLTIGSAKFMIGDFVSVVIDFLILSLVVYFGFRALGLARLDKPKS